MRPARSIRRQSAIVAGLALAAVTALPTGAAELPPGGTFMDDDDSVHEGGIEAIAAEGLTVGCNPPHGDRFCPARSLTRAEMATMLVRALSSPAADTDYFVDDEGHILEGAINRMAEAGLTQGCNPPDNDRFCPQRVLTRAEAAAFIARARGLPPSPTDFFVDDDGHVLEGAIDRLAEAGITSGCNPPANDRFCPRRHLTRAEMATMLSRAFGLDAVRPPERQVELVVDLGIDIGFDPRDESLERGTFWERHRLVDWSLGCQIGEDLRRCTIDITEDNAEVFVKLPDGTEDEVATHLFYYPQRFIPSSEEGVYEFTIVLDSGVTYRAMFDFKASRLVDLVNTGHTRIGENGELLTAFSLEGVDLTEATSVLHHRADGTVDGGIPSAVSYIDEYFWVELGDQTIGEHTILAKVNGQWHYAIELFPGGFD